MLITEDRVCCLLLLVGYSAGFVVLSPHVHNLLTPCAQSSLLEPPFVLNIFSFSKFSVWILHNCMHISALGLRTESVSFLLWVSVFPPFVSASRASA